MAAGGDVVFSGNLMDPEAWDDTALVVAYERAITSFRSVSIRARQTGREREGGHCL
jgi:hypothetical protein